MAGQIYKDSSRPGISNTPVMRKKVSAPGNKARPGQPTTEMLKASQQALEEFNREQSAKFIKNVLAWGILSLLFLGILIGYFLGFFDKFISLVLTPERGVYADCNLYENRNSKFCIPSKTSTDIQWDAISTSGGKAVPYTLTDSHK